MISRNIQSMSRNQNTSPQAQEQGFSRELLATVWQRMAQMSSAERNLLINHLRSADNNETAQSNQPQQEPQPTNERRRLFNISTPPNREENEYIDFRLYPITIDWNQIENGESYFYNLFTIYGYFGVSLITSLFKLQKKFKFAIESLYQIVLEYYHSLVLARQDTALAEFISFLPSLTQMHQVIKHSYYSAKELPLMKLLLDIYEHYLFSYTDHLQIDMRGEYILVAALFYQTIQESDLKFIQEEFAKHKKLMAMINSFKMLGTQRRDSCLDRIDDLAVDYQSLLKGTKENMFIL